MPGFTPHDSPYPTNDTTHQAAYGLSQLLELGTSDGVWAVLHHGVHVWVQVSAQQIIIMDVSLLFSFHSL